MKSSTMNLMLATAALLVASTMALATNLTARIPFTFRAGGAVLEPGRYIVKAKPGEAGFELRNVKTGRNVLLAVGVPQDPRKEWKNAEGGVLQFTCGERGCALREIWTNSGAPAHKYSMPKAEDGMSARVLMIRMAGGR